MNIHMLLASSTYTAVKPKCWSDMPYIPFSFVSARPAVGYNVMDHDEWALIITPLIGSLTNMD